MGRVESQNHWFTYDEKMQVESVAQAVSNLAIQFGDSDDDAGVMSRPFGVAILFAGMDDNGTQLYQTSEGVILAEFARGLPQEHDPKGGHQVCFHHPEAGYG